MTNGSFSLAGSALIQACEKAGVKIPRYDCITRHMIEPKTDLIN